MSTIHLAATDITKPRMFGLPNRLARWLAVKDTARCTQSSGDHDRINTAISLQHMANEVEAIQPNLASELRSLASRY